MASATPTSDPRWRRTDPALVRTIEWDAVRVLYHRPSGKTHFINAAMAAVFDRLSDATTVHAVAARLAEAQGATLDADAMRDVSAMLTTLEELGLAERA